MALPSKRPARPRAAAAPRVAAPPPATEPTAAASSDPAAATTTTHSPDTTPVTVTLRAVPAAPAAARAAAAVAFSHRGASFEPAPPVDGACVVVGGGTGTLVPAADGGGVPAPAAPARAKPPASGVFGPRPKAVQAGPGAAAVASDEAQADAAAVTEAGVQAGPADGAGAPAPGRHPTRSVAAAARLLARAAAASTNRTPAADAVSWDDPSDARSATAASLLPLWSLPPALPASGRRAAPLPVAALAWCTAPPHAALAVAYGRTQPGAPGGGAVAVWAPAVDAAAPLWRVATPCPATCLAFEPGGARLAVGFANGSVCVYDGVDGEAVEEEEGVTSTTTTTPTLRGGPDGHASAVASVAWLAPDAADGALLASTGADGHVVAWRAARGGSLAAARVATLPADPAADADPAAGLPPAALVGGTSLFVAPPPHDGALLVGDDGGGARVIVPAAGAAPAAAFGGATAPLVAAAWSPVTRGAFLTVSADGRVGFWQAARRAPAASIDLPSPAVAAAWLPRNATAAVVALADGSVAALELTRAPRGAPLLVQRVLPAGVAPTAVAVAAGDAALVAVGDGRGRVAVLRPSPNVRTPAVEATQNETEAAPGETDQSGGATPRGGDTAAATAAPATDAARLDATLDWLRAAGAGY